MKRMAPPSALDPNKVPCGPRSTSTRSKSKTAGSVAPTKPTMPTRTCTGTSSI
jgi:hypothetical protein